MIDTGNQNFNYRTIFMGGGGWGGGVAGGGGGGGGGGGVGRGGGGGGVSDHLHKLLSGIQLTQRRRNTGNEAKCPFHHETTGGTTNRTEWPNS